MVVCILKLNSFLHGRGHFCPLSRFFVINPRNIFISNQLHFELSFITNNSWKYEVAAKATKSFPEVTFLKSEHFLPKFILKDVIRCFCEVTTFTGAFYDSVSKKPVYKVWTACDVITKWRHFQKYGRNAWRPQQQARTSCKRRLFVEADCENSLSLQNCWFSDF